MTTDNITLNAGTGGDALATAEVSHSGDTVHLQIVALAGLTGSEGSWTFAPINGDATDGLLVNLGSNNDVLAVGDVAHDAATGSAGPVGIGGYASGSAPSDVSADGDRVWAWFDPNGSQMVQLAVNGAIIPGDASAGLTVNLGSNNDVTLATLPDTSSGDLAAINTAVSGTLVADVTGQGDVPITLGGEAVVLGAGTAAFGKLAANSGVDIGDVDVTSISAGSNLIGDVGLGVRTSGGCSIYYDADLDETAVAVKAGAGQVYAIHAWNTTAAPLFLQLFNVAQGSVTVGTTTPDMQYVIPGNADSDGAGFVFSVPQGIAFSTAITAACSTDTEGNSAPGTGACIIDILYA